VNRQGPKIAVGIPLYGYLPALVAWKNYGLLIQWTVQRDMHVLLGSENCYLPWARRDIVNDALDAGCTHLFFYDQDVIVPADTIRRLYAWQKPIVGALYYQKVQGHAPVAGNFDDNDLGWSPLPVIKDTLQRVDVVGMGATLIDLDVFRKLEAAHRFLHNLGDNEPSEQHGMGWFDMNARTGEDIEFCRRAAHAGYKIYVDPTIETLHVGATPISRRYYAPAPVSLVPTPPTQDQPDTVPPFQPS